MLSLVGLPPNIPQKNSHKEEDGLEQEPSPTATLLFFLACVASRSSRALASVCSDIVQVLGLERDYIVIVTQLTRFSTETEIRDRGNRNVRLGCCQSEAVCPRVLVLVLQIER